MPKAIGTPALMARPMLMRVCGNIILAAAMRGPGTSPSLSSLWLMFV